MRLNKFISETGLCSRREADQLIEQGRVKVNGQLATLGTQVEDGDEVRVNGKQVGAKRQTVYLALHKPRGITCTTDRRDPTNIIDYLNYPERVFPIGRLDKDSEGLILLTNDGDIVNQILRVENQHDKEYRVSVDQPLTPQFLAGMAKGVPILDTVTLPCELTATGDTSFRMVLRQGLNRQIRRMCEHFGYEVKRLQRVRVMNIHLKGLAVGQWRALTLPEIQGLMGDTPTQRLQESGLHASHQTSARPQQVTRRVARGSQRQPSRTGRASSSRPASSPPTQRSKRPSQRPKTKH